MQPGRVLAGGRERDIDLRQVRRDPLLVCGEPESWSLPRCAELAGILDQFQRGSFRNAPAPMRSQNWRDDSTRPRGRWTVMMMVSS